MRFIHLATGARDDARDDARVRYEDGDVSTRRAARTLRRVFVDAVAVVGAAAVAIDVDVIVAVGIPRARTPRLDGGGRWGAERGDVGGGAAPNALSSIFSSLDVNDGTDIAPGDPGTMELAVTMPLGVFPLAAAALRERKCFNVAPRSMLAAALPSAAGGKFTETSPALLLPRFERLACELVGASEGSPAGAAESNQFMMCCASPVVCDCGGASPPLLFPYRTNALPIVPPCDPAMACGEIIS